MDKVKHKTHFKQALIDPQALNIVRNLQKFDHTAYLVGGCVRDLLLGLPPKDFDIATSARPRQISKIIRPSFIIGKRFRLVLVKRQGRQFEVSTFRSLAPANSEDSGPLKDDNTFGTPEEDAHRRDFTINSLFYDPVKQELLDYTGGMEEIHRREIKIIGDPQVRIQEDPIRMLRALRFSHRTGFQMEPSLREAIAKNSDQLKLSVLPRRREEFLKLLKLKGSQVKTALWEAQDLGLLTNLAPSVSKIFDDEDLADSFCKTLVRGLSFVADIEDNQHLVSVLLYSLFSTEDEHFDCNLKASEKKKKETLDRFKNELGVFKTEQEVFFRAINLLRQLQQVKDPNGIRQRYRQHIISKRCLPISLSLAAAYQLLSGSHLCYWLDLYNKNESI